MSTVVVAHATTSYDDYCGTETTPLMRGSPTRQGFVRSYVGAQAKRRSRGKNSCKVAKCLDSSQQAGTSSSCLDSRAEEGGEWERDFEGHSSGSSPTRFGASFQGIDDDSDSEAWEDEPVGPKAAGSAEPPRPTLRSRLKIPIPEGVSLTLHNSGSVARDHLASERTFLAYMRTSLAVASSGVDMLLTNSLTSPTALVQLFTAASVAAPSGAHRLHAFVRPLGAAAVSLGLVVLFIGAARYFSVQAALTKGKFPVARFATGFVAFALSALVTATFAILVAGKLEPKRNGF